MSIKSKTIRYVMPMYYDSCPGSGPKIRYYVNTRGTLLQTRTGGSNPKYKVQISRGENATTEMLATREYFYFHLGRIKYRNVYKSYPNYGMTGESTHLGLSVLAASKTISQTLLDESKNKAAIGIRMKIKAQETAYSAFTILGEIRETLHQIRHPAEAMRIMLGGFLNNELSRKRRRYYGKTKRQYAHGLAGSWLEFSFGLKPLIGDITSIAEASLVRFNEDRIIRLSYTGIAESASSRVESVNLPGTSIMGYYSRDETRTAKTRYIVGYRQKIDDDEHSVLAPSVRNVIALGGFNLSELVPTAWELLPWSFFIDYFSNIGQVIESSLVSLQDVAWVNETQIFENTVKRHSGSYAGLYKSAYQQVESVDSANQEATYRRVNRKTADIPFGNISLRLPGQKAQFLNIGALMALQFK